MFDRLLKLNLYSGNPILQKMAGQLLEKLYGCEIRCAEIDKSVLFAHHARGCTIVAAKICANVVIYQNVTLGSNMRYHKTRRAWENVGVPVIGRNVTIGDGAKILGPVVIGENTVIAAGTIITQNIPADSLAYGINKFRPRDTGYNLIFNANMISPEEIMTANNRLIAEFNREASSGYRERQQDASAPATGRCP